MTTAVAVAVVVVGLVAAVVVAVVLARAAETERRLTRRLAQADETAARARAGQRALQAALDRMEEALHELALGVVVCGAAGEVVYRNRMAETFVGARHGDALVAQLIDELRDAALRGEPAVERLDLHGPPRRCLELVARPLGTDDTVEGAVVVVEDVSALRYLEEVRQDFVSNLTHELKTPVGALSLLADTLGDETEPEVVARLAARIQMESARVTRIVEDLLDLSRLEAEPSPRREPVGIASVVGQVVDHLREKAVRRGITVRVAEIPSGLMVAGDGRQLVTAVANLLDNAVKYSDDHGVVEVEVRLDADVVEVDVRDEGIGIPSREHERVFERFYRVDPARGRATGGTGLGLAIVRHIARNHGGDVTVRSSEGLGSTFTLRLPAHQEEPVGRPARSREREAS